MSQSHPNHDNCLYFDITKQERDSAVRYLLGNIIQTRRESSFPSNHYTYDEDVNVYMAHLLFAISLPEYHEMAEPYLSTNSSDILKWVRATEDRTIRYFIFKVNADYILIHSAVFNDLSGKKSKVFTKSQKHFFELAKLYYDQAAAYHKRIYRKQTGVGEVLQKLSDYFDDYQSILKGVRENYFEFMDGFKDQAFDQFMNQFENYEGEERRKVCMDYFLEIYGRWLETKDTQLIPKIQQMVKELGKLDPEFQFDFDKEIYGTDGGWDDQKKCA